MKGFLGFPVWDGSQRTVNLQFSKIREARKFNIHSIIYINIRAPSIHDFGEKF